MKWFYSIKKALPADRSTFSNEFFDAHCAEVCAPLFDKITIELSPQYYSGREFVIETVNNSSDNVYIQKAYLNGKELIVPKLTFKDVIKGGKLVLYMGNKPNFNWGIDK